MADFVGVDIDFRRDVPGLSVPHCIPVSDQLPFPIRMIGYAAVVKKTR